MDEYGSVDFMSLHTKVWFRSAVALAIVFLYSMYYAFVVLPSYEL